MQKRYWRTHATQGHYNTRFKPSNVHSEAHDYSYDALYYPPEGAEKTRTDRNPNNFKFTPNFFKEWKHEWADFVPNYLYQISKRIHRSNDVYSYCLASCVLLSGYLFPISWVWRVSFFATFLGLITRIRDKAFEPRVDEVYVLDQLFQNKEVSKYFNMKTYYIIDFDQEYVKGLDDPKFPEYKSTSSRFFNVDNNTTEGFYVIGDVESGATMRVKAST